MCHHSHVSHVSNNIIVPMRELADGDGEVLAGAPHGRQVFVRMVDRTAQEPSLPVPVFLDFQGVSVATASFLRETVFRYRDDVRKRRSNLYPVVANINQLILDELDVLTAAENDAVMVCELRQRGHPSNAKVVGRLDPKQRITFDLVIERGEADAGELMESFGDQEEKRVGQTAWNNRLSSLATLGLIVELNQGRSKRYRPLLQEN